MPEISRFYGIVIGMFYDDHPPPHFHVRCGEFEAAIRIEGLAVTEGKLPSRAQRMVFEWAALHQKELLVNWRALKTDRPLKKIGPLE